MLNVLGDCLVCIRKSTTASGAVGSNERARQVDQPFNLPAIGRSGDSSMAPGSLLCRISVPVVR